ncbi:CopD family protein [Chryseobacterium sp. 1B4]
MHILSVLYYFTGVLYIGKLFLCYRDTNKCSSVTKKILRTQYVFAIERIWNIVIIPGGLIMLATGLIMFLLNKKLVAMQWFDLKLIFLCMLTMYHYWFLEQIRHLKELQGYNLKVSSIKLKQINEMGLLLLFLLSLSVALKYTLSLPAERVIIEMIILLFILVAILKLLKKEE